MTMTDRGNQKTIRGEPSDNKTLQDAIRGEEIDLAKYYNELSMPSRGPVIFIAACMMVVGFVVNSCVMYVFLKRFSASALRTYLVTLAFFDFLACSVGLPLEIYVTLNAYLIPGDWLCKLHFAVTSLSTTTSSFTTIAIALDRLRRMNKPTFKDEDKYRSYWVVAVVVIMGSTMTLPFVAMVGVSKRRLPTKDSFEREQWLHACWVKEPYDKDKTLMLPSMYSTVQNLTYLSGMFLLLCSYGIIYFKIHQMYKSVSKRINYDLAHPVRKYHLKLPDIPLKTPQTPIDAGLTFAAKLHTRVSSKIPLPSTSGSAVQIQSRSMMVRASFTAKGGMGKIKRMSRAVVDFFVEPPKENSSSAAPSGTNFVSKRADATFLISPAETMEGDDRSGREIPLIKGTLVDGQSKTSLNLNQSAGIEQDKETPAPVTPELVIDINQATENRPAEVPFTPPAADAAVEEGRRFSGQSLIEKEMTLTLALVDRIKDRATDAMTDLIALYIATWLPHLLFRQQSKKPLYVCTPEENCWTNYPAYAILSVFISSTTNPFFYCFRSVHFRKQVRRMIRDLRRHIRIRCARQPVAKVEEKEEPKPPSEQPVNQEANQPVNEEANQPEKEGGNQPETDGDNQPKNKKDNQPEGEAKSVQESKGVD